MKNFKILFFLSSLLLTGCESDQVLITSTIDLDKNKAMSYPGKPAAAVSMAYEMDKSIQAGKAISITIKFTNSVDVDDLMINFKLDAGLSTQNSLQTSFGVLPAGETSVINMPIVAANDGRYYINVTATLVTDKNQGRSFVIPVNVGNVDAKQTMKVNGNVETDSSGRKIITMPAQMDE